jgi:hypothetical protein
MYGQDYSHYITYFIYNRVHKSEPSIRTKYMRCAVLWPVSRGQRLVVCMRGPAIVRSSSNKCGVCLSGGRSDTSVPRSHPTADNATLSHLYFNMPLDAHRFRDIHHGHDTVSSHPTDKDERLSLRRLSRPTAHLRDISFFFPLRIYAVQYDLHDADRPTCRPPEIPSR